MYMLSMEGIVQYGKKKKNYWTAKRNSLDWQQIANQPILLLDILGVSFASND